jgi:hypothetical protein
MRSNEVVEIPTDGSRPRQYGSLQWSWVAAVLQQPPIHQVAETALNHIAAGSRRYIRLDSIPSCPRIIRIQPMQLTKAPKWTIR